MLNNPLILVVVLTNQKFILRVLHLKEYKIICIDMFQTLVNIDTRIEHIWKRILKDDYNEELRDKYVQIVRNKIVDKFHVEESAKHKFRNLKKIFFESFKDIFEENKVKYCSSYATKVFIEEHNRAELYHDSKEFIERAKKKYILCLVSDADIEMVESLINTLKFDEVFISENVKAYKGNSNYKIFKEVINHYNLDPDQILHIGDSSSDMLGANRAGIDTCWINRHKYKRRFDITPNYEVKSLDELFTMLNI